MSTPTARRVRHIARALSPAPCDALRSPLFKKVLVVNRGEIAIRIMRAAKALGIPSVAIYAAADKDALHLQCADEAFEVKAPAGKEADAIAPYLNIDEVMRVAKECGADAAHPGYGFLAESAPFAAACEQNNVMFIGPSSININLFGDKTLARELAEKADVPVARGSPTYVKDVAEAKAMIAEHKIPFPILLKAAFGGGGRGQRVVESEAELEDNLRKCMAEAEMSFGNGACFLEEFVKQGRHIEVQIMGDTHGNTIHLVERDCSVQLRNQKVVEVAPAREIHPGLRERITGAALRLAKAANYHCAGTVEFLVSGELQDPEAHFIFLEVNPRIQVEHTITEEITGVDLVQTQIKVCAGGNLTSMGLSQDAIVPKGFAMQSRITLMPGAENPITKYEPPTGEGIRLDSGVEAGRTPSGSYDPMLAKLIVSVPEGKTFADCIDKMQKALDDFVFEGIKLNFDMLHNILASPEFNENKLYTNFMSKNMAAMTKPYKKGSKKKKAAKKKEKADPGPPRPIEIISPFPGQVTEINVKPGDEVVGGQTLCIISAMKMFNDIPSTAVGVVKEVRIPAVDTQVNEGTVLVVIEGVPAVEEEEEEDDEEAGAAGARLGGGDGGGAATYISKAYYDGEAEPVGPSTSRIKSKVKTDEAAFKARHAHHLALAEELKERVTAARKGGGGKYEALHRSRGKFLARERIAEIIDPGTRFLELSTLAAYGRYDGRVHSAGMITGIGLVHGRECMFLCNDATVKGGVFFPETFDKYVRAQEIAEANHLACIYIVDGGGAKLDAGKDGGIDAKAFTIGGRQFRNQAVMSSKKIPQISLVVGMCTAGGAYVPAMSDESIIVKNNGTIYLGGPPLVKAATGEECNEQDLGGAVMHCSKSGVTDHFAEDEPHAFKYVRQVVENLQRKDKVKLHMGAGDAPHYNPEELLGIIPESNSIPFDIREIIARVVDGSRFHEFKARYGPTIVCGFAHIHGYPVGIVANNGMLFSEASIKATHFIENCGQRGTPLLFLHNITGFMIGTKYEQGGITKDGAKLVMAVSCVPVPKFSVIVAGSHGAGNYAMCGQAFDPRFTFLWPNAKVSVMGGQQAADVIRIVKDNQLKREGKDPLTQEQIEMIREPIVDMFDKGSTAYAMTACVGDDGIIDPRDTRDVLGMALSASLNAPTPTNGYGVFRM